MTLDIAPGFRGAGMPVLTGPAAPFVIIYVRISVADVRDARKQARAAGLTGQAAREAEERLMSEKVEMHADECREFTALQGWAIGYEDSDNNRSASPYSTRSLPGRERTLGVIREHAGQRVILVTTEIPRLLRKNDDAKLFRDVVRRPHLVIMCTQGDPEGEGDRYDLNMGKGLERFQDAVNRAEAESRAISERRRRRERKRATAGEFWGNAPFGYRKVHVDEDGYENTEGRGRYTGTLRIIPGEAAVIREAARLLIDCDGGRPRPGARPGEPWEGSLRQIVLSWNAAELQGRQGAKWSQKTLRSLLLDPVLNGWRVHRAGDNDGRAPRGSEGKRRRGIWEPILDDDTSARLTAILGRDARRQSRGNVRVHPGAGLVFAPCGALCKVHVSPGHKSGKDGSQKRYRSYICPDPAAGGDRCVRRDADKVDALMRDYVNWWLEPGGDYARYTELVRARGDLTGQIESVSQEITDLDNRLASATSAASRGTITWERLGEVDADISRQRDELELVRDALKAARAVQAGELEPARPVHADVWEGWTAAEQNAWLRRFIGKVTVRPGQGQARVRPARGHRGARRVGGRDRP